MSFIEYPKMIYRVNGEAIESIVVDSEAEETAKAVDGFTSDLASIADPETGKPLPVAEETAKAPKGKKKPAVAAEETPVIIEEQAE